jgi:hypothetical protein
MAPSATKVEEPVWLIAKEAFIIDLPDHQSFIGRANITRIRADAPMFRGEGKRYLGLFKPLTASYDIESATAGPGERRA